MFKREKEAVKSPQLDSSVKTFAIQYNGEFELHADRDYHILDLFNYGVNDIGRVIAAGSIPVAYFSTQYEDFQPARPDSSEFKPEWIHGGLDGWDGESVLKPEYMREFTQIMLKRVDLAVAKKFQAIDADNLDAYWFYHDSKSKATCAMYWNQIAEYARSKGLLVGLKNCSFLHGMVDPDFCVTESAYKWNESEAYKRFGVPVLNTEYSKAMYDRSKQDDSVFSLYKHKIRMDSTEYH